MRPIKYILAFSAIVAAFTAGAEAQQTLLAGYDFQTGSNASAASPNTPTSYISPFGTQAGTASLHLDGTLGSFAYTPATQLNSQAGTAVNAGPGFSTSTAAPGCLTIINANGTAGNNATTDNNQRIVFALTMTNYQSLVVTFASYRSASGFNNNSFSYSLDGTTFTNAGVTIAQTDSSTYDLETADLSGITALNNAPTVYIGYTLDYVNTSNSGTNRLDNFQFNASVVPEPATYLGGFGMVALLGLELYRRRSRMLS